MTLSHGTVIAAALSCLSLPSALAAAPRSVAGQWIEVGSGGAVTRYVASTSIIHEDNYAVIWRLQDYKSDNFINASRFHSIKYQVEYDCASHQRRGIYYEIYAGHMGTGRLVDLSYDQDRWRSLPVDGGTGFRIACGLTGAPDQVATAP